jgi:predicted transcriptional regulator
LPFEKQQIHLLKRKNMNTTEKVLSVFQTATEPLNAGKVETLSGLDRKEVDKAMKELKNSGAIVSPKRCYWEAAK